MAKKPIRKWGAADRRPLKVNVSEADNTETIEETTEETAEEAIETPVDTVEENKIPEVETVEEVNVPVEEKAEEKVEEKKDKKPSIKEWTEEELAVLSREEFARVEEEIRQGKAKVKPRIINR